MTAPPWGVGGSDARKLMLVMLVAALPACSMMMGGRSEAVSVNSDPPGQQVQIDGRAYSTPVTVKLDRRQEHVVVMPDGQEVEIKRKLDPWFLASLFWFPVGPVIDLTSGYATGNLSPDDLDFCDGKIFSAGKPMKKR